MHHQFMWEAIKLAEKGRGTTSPNPMVGAVLVKDNQVVGSGFHKRAGGPHAEVVALKQAGREAQGSDLYVTLEPCCVHGRTPPCTEAIWQSGVKRVFVGMIDPNPRVAGRGVKWLKEKGLAVETGFYQKELTQLNQAYLKFITQGLPFITLKGALSLDGKIATRTGDSFCITSEKARRRAMELRFEADAVLVGIETVLFDDPRLTIRLNSKEAKEKRFYRIVLDSQARLPLHSKLVKTAKDGPILLVTTERASEAKLAQLSGRDVEVAKLPSANGRVDLVSLVEYLGERNITHLLVEGGGQVNAAFFEAGLYDRVVLFLAPLLLGGESAPSWLRGEGVSSLKEAVRLKVTQSTYLGDDLMLVGYPQKRGG